MGAIGGLLGTAGGASGTGFAAPQAAPIIPGTNPDQIAASYGQNQTALAGQQALLQALQAQNGLGNQTQVYNQLQGVANGTGPNPAQAMLANATGTNVANQAALMAGQRGAGANVGLIGRQAAQTGAGIQQNAAGQAAALQANQSLNALNQMGGLANQQAGQQIGQTNAGVGSQQSEQQILQNSLANQNQQNVAMQGNVNQANAGLAGTTMKGQQALVGGLGNAGSAASGLMGSSGSQGALLFAGARGGTVPGYAHGGSVRSVESFFSGGKTPLGGPQSEFGRFLMGQHQPMAQGGNVGQRLRSGGAVPGQAAVKGDSYKNDTVNAKLSPGELVVDRDTMGDKGPAGQAARFLAAVIQAKNRGGK